VRGITSRVDIVWRSGGIQLKRIVEAVVSSTINGTKLYKDIYYISQLNTSDDKRVVQCEIIIMATPPIITVDNVTLDVTGKCFFLKIRCIAKYIYTYIKIVYLHT